MGHPPNRQTLFQRNIRKDVKAQEIRHFWCHLFCMWTHHLARPDSLPALLICPTRSRLCLIQRSVFRRNAGLSKLSYRKLRGRITRSNPTQRFSGLIDSRAPTKRLGKILRITDHSIPRARGPEYGYRLCYEVYRSILMYPASGGR